MAISLPVLAANSTVTNQNLMQNGSQTAQATDASGSSVNQNLDQAAGQTVQGSVAGNNQSAPGIGNGTSGLMGSSSNLNQNLVQRADQTAAGSNLSAVNQNLSQNANQNVSGLGTNETVNQSLAQLANQTFLGLQSNATGSNQTEPQNNTNQTGNNQTGNNQTGNINRTVPWNESDYWTNLTTPLSDQDRLIMNNRTEQFLASYTAARGYVIPWNDLTRLAGDRNRNLDIIYIDESGWNREGRISGSSYIPLDALYNRIDQLPKDRPIVIVGDNSWDAATAMTILRMQGYNAWVAQRQGNSPTGSTNTIP